MATRNKCFRLMAWGLISAISMAILIGTRTLPSYQVSHRKARIPATVSRPMYRTNSPTAPKEPETAIINASEVLRMREWVMKHFNPDKDLTIDRSKFHIGQRVKYDLDNNTETTITSHIYSVIPVSSPLLGKHFQSCAVVGNSGILLGSRCGPQIDSADFVFRPNLPPTEGFETDVGSFSNFTTMNPSVLPHDYEGYLVNSSVQKRFVERLRAIGNQILHIPALVAPGGRPKVGFTLRIIKKNHLPLKLTIAPSGTTQKMTALWEDSEFEPKRPSTGSILFALAACMCDQIHLYGFYPFVEDNEGRKIQYHYYGEGRRMLQAHNMSEEYRGYQVLHQRKALVLHTEPCYDTRRKENKFSPP